MNCVPFTFRVLPAKISPIKRKIIDKTQLQNHFTAAYGIFSGQAKHTGKLRFDTTIAREISQQQWHPEQIAEWDSGAYLLTIP